MDVRSRCRAVGRAACDHPAVLPNGWHATGLQIESGQAWLSQVRREGQDEGLFALKRLKNPTRAARFAREANTMIALRGRGVSVPQIVDSDLQADRPWFAMHWFADGSLETPSMTGDSWISEWSGSKRSSLLHRL
jgi:aminoglycoside phosphotransferase